MSVGQSTLNGVASAVRAFVQASFDREAVLLSVQWPTVRSPPRSRNRGGPYEPLCHHGQAPARHRIPRPRPVRGFIRLEMEKTKPRRFVVARASHSFKHLNMAECENKIAG